VGTYCSKSCYKDSDCPGTDVCKSSSKGYICRKSDGTSPSADSGAPSPTPPESGGGAPSPDAGAPYPTPPNDTTAPKVIIASPANNTQVTSSITVKATITDDVGVTSAELLVNNSLVASKSSAPFDFPTVLQSGIHIVTVVAYDAAKNKGQASVSVTVAGGAPQPAPKLDTGGAPAPSADGGLLPPSTGSNNPFGSKCTKNTDCANNMCAFDPAVNESYCAQKCGAADWCPPGGVCLKSSGGKLCALQLNNMPQAGGGCSLGTGAATGGGLGLMLLGLLVLLVRRRRP